MGDLYVLKITENGVTRTSSGTVMAYSGNKFTLAASINVSVSFEVVISSSGGITSITGTITVQGGGTVIGPGSITTGNEGGNSGFVAVTNITGIPSGALVGTPLTLSGTVAPSNATNKAIVWSVQSAGATGALISGNTLTITAAGSVTVTATIANGKTANTPYIQDFAITINAGGGNTGDDNSKLDAFVTWLNAQQANTETNPYSYTLNLSSLSSRLRSILISVPSKYISLDLSGSTFTSIEREAFSGCTSLTSVTIGSGVTSIESQAFRGVAPALAA
jgi:hypothetical protein